MTILLTLSTLPVFAGSSSVSGSVIFEGKAPTPPILNTRGEKYCEEIHAKNPIHADGAAIGSKGEFEYIFVWIDNSPAGDYPAPEEKAYLSQKNCRYEQPVIAFMTNQTLEIHNLDDTTHNVRGFARNNKIFNFGQPAGLPPRTRTFKNPETPIRIKCDVHSWMNSWAFILPHPFFDVTGPEGTFEIKDLPAGTYTLKSWHEKLGEQSQEITVGATPTSSILFTYSRSGKKGMTRKAPTDTHNRGK
jgi:hypothetical protein